MSNRRGNWLIGCGALVFVVQSFLMTIAVAEEPDSIYFHDDYNKALQEAKLTGKPLFIEFRCAP